MRKKLIILAAGEGTRLRPLTSDMPKCMVPIAGKSLLEWQLSTAKTAGFKDEEIVIVAGYKSEKIPDGNWVKLVNHRYEQTNMVWTLGCAEKYFDSGIVVSYGDIVYTPDVLEKVVKSQYEIGVVIDHDWRSYWERRFDDALDDAESLKLDGGGRIIEIGQKPSSILEIEGQYIGLMVFQGDGLKTLRCFYKSETQANDQKSAEQSAQKLDSLYMTDMLQELINNQASVYEIPIHGHWLEVDNISDLRLAESFCHPNGDSLRIERK